MIKIKFKYNKCIGSIVRLHYHSLKYQSFKYNKCIGSMAVVANTTETGLNLNTTNVSVQLWFMVRNTLHKHYLNTTNVSVQFEKGGKVDMSKMDLNTTNVSVQSFYIRVNVSNLFYLNTTNVSVQSPALSSTFIKAIRFKYNKCIGSIR